MSAPPSHCNGQRGRAQVIQGDAHDPLLESAGDFRPMNIEEAGADIADAARLLQLLQVLGFENARAGEDQVAGQRADAEEV